MTENFGLSSYSMEVLLMETFNISKAELKELMKEALVSVLTERKDRYPHTPP
jgi:hypothetical protein